MPRLFAQPAARHDGRPRRAVRPHHGPLRRPLPVTPRPAARRSAATACGADWSQNCFLQHAVAGLSIGLILVDNFGRLVWLNRAASQLLGLDHARCLDRPFKDALLDPQFAAFWNEVSCRGGNCMADISIRWPRRIDLKLNATACTDPAGEQIGRALLFCDITSERSASIELTREIADRLRDLAPAANEPPSALSRLTASELRTFRHLGEGLTNDAIAARLHVAVSTVRSHLKRAYAKLGLHTRAQAVSFAVRHRLADPARLA